MFKHPEQMELEFEDTVESYACGYDTGLFWDANWMPGGPHVYSGKYKHMRDQSKREYDAWQRGFKDGLEVRMLDKSFAAWWNVNRGKYYARYHAETLPLAA